VTVADTWDEAACRARLVAVTPGEWAHRQTGRADLHNVEDLVECGDLLIAVTPGVGTDRAAIARFIAHAPADLRAALAEIDRLRAALRPFAALAARPEVRDWSGGCGLVVYGLGSPNLGDCRRAAAALGGRP
jgi:hypothetical protein